MKICPICNTPHFNDNSVSSLCEEHELARNKGLLAIVEIHNYPSDGDLLASNEAKPTGKVAYLNRHTYANFFGTAEEFDHSIKTGLIYTSEESFNQLEAMAAALGDDFPQNEEENKKQLEEFQSLIRNDKFEPNRKGFDKRNPLDNESDDDTTIH